MRKFVVRAAARSAAARTIASAFFVDTRRRAALAERVPNDDRSMRRLMDLSLILTSSDDAVRVGNRACC